MTLARWTAGHRVYRREEWMANPYEVLGVSRNADPETIKREYKRLARQFHPDRNRSPGAEQQFKEINGAYHIVGDDERRALYDEFGEVAFKPGFDAEQARYWSSGDGGRRAGSNPYDFGQGFSMDDILGSLFGDDARARNAGRKGEDQVVNLVVSPMAAIRGGETTVDVRRPTGRTDRVSVRIPPGARDGGKLRLKGQGLPPSGGGPCGDLVVRLKIPLHTTLRRDEDDLEMDVPVTILEAMRGAKVTVPTPTGNVRVTVPAGCKPGQRLRLRGRGVQRPARPGDLYLVLTPVVPTNPDSDAIRAAEALEDAYGGDVRAGLNEVF